MSQRKRTRWLGGAFFLLVAAGGIVFGGEKQIVSLRDMSEVEVKQAGFELRQEAPVHIVALGGGGDYGWTYKSDEMFAYAWIIDADTRNKVWEMTAGNSSKSKDDRSFDGTVTLSPGSYEVYFAAAVFAYHSTFSHMRTNVDHRRSPLFGERKKGKTNFFEWFSGWWSDDIAKDWDKRAKHWGVDVYVDESVPVSSFQPPKQASDVVFKATGLGDDETIRQGFSLADEATIHIYAIGEGQREGELADYGWIVSQADRKRVWEMQLRNCSRAGGAKKNILTSADVTLPRGDYVLYCITDDSHSADDWNENPPYDPLNWGVTLSVSNEKEQKAFKTVPYTEDRNVIVSLVHPKDDDYLSAGFTLKEDAKVRVYAIGERGSSRRMMADFGTILNAKTRKKVWTMDFDRTSHAGGAGKNRYIDEVISLPRGSYIVTYQTDDSHSYDDWNSTPPYDKEHYGITAMGAGERWNPGIVAKYVEERDKNIIAQIVRVGDGADLTERFTLDKTTRVRIYAIGEGQGREMYDYGWFEDAKTGTVIWEMTYGMTFHAGGGRKNRMVNTTILLERGEYRLRYKSDDSHSFGDWNVDPPEDQQYWGITLYRDDGSLPPVPPHAPHPPVPGDDEEE
ncbi:MAG: hypothetical protein AB1428_02280 [Bacteroidota bacterium]